MKRTTQHVIPVRMPRETVKRLDKLAKKLTARTLGAHIVTRSEAMRIAVGRGLAILLVGCSAAPATIAATDAACSPPTFTGTDCFSPGGGVTRCHEADGSFWDRQADGTRLHWRWADDAGFVAETICEVK